MEPIDQAIATNEELVTLTRKKVALLEELGKSLRIMKVWPEAFKGGAKVSIHGNTGTRQVPIYKLSRDDGLTRSISKAEHDFIKAEIAKK